MWNVLESNGIINKMVKATLHFNNAYEQNYRKGGINVSITRNGREFFFRMFNSNLTHQQVKNKFRWRASKKLKDETVVKDSLIIKEYVNKYGGFFGKIIRVNKTRYIILFLTT